MMPTDDSVNQRK